MVSYILTIDGLLLSRGAMTWTEGDDVEEIPAEARMACQPFVAEDGQVGAHLFPGAPLARPFIAARIRERLTKAALKRHVTSCTTNA